MAMEVPVQLVVRDREGDWQFLPHIENIDEEKPLVVALYRVISCDPTLVDILKLECGTRAWRRSIKEDWFISNYA
jgi:hypothetical protein